MQNNSFPPEQEPVADEWVMVPTRMNADMINAWSGGITVSSDEVAYRTTFQDAWTRVLAARPSPSEAVEARRPALEEAADLIEAHIIQDTSAGKVLRPRQDGNVEGLAYAAAIRALIQKDKADE